MTSNEELMQSYLAGDQMALGVLYERLQEPLYCFLYRYTREEQLSIDIVHDTFEILQSKKVSFDPAAGTVKAWIFQIAYRRMLNKLNRRKKWQTLLPFLVPTPKKTLATDETLIIQQAVSNLPEKQRAVILLAYYEDLPQEDIAQILSIPLGTVKSRLHNAIKALKMELQEDFKHERNI